MQDNIINAHRLIGEAIREPGDERCGRIVGVDQSRSVPVIFVIWHAQAGIQRVELTREELRQLADACTRVRSAVGESSITGDSGSDAARSAGDASAEIEVTRRRVGSR